MSQSTHPSDEKSKMGHPGSGENPPAYSYPESVQPSTYPQPANPTTIVYGYNQPGYVIAPPGAPLPQQQQGPGGAVINQPQVVTMAPMPPGDAPPDHFTFAVMVTICCFWPVGIFAIMRAMASREAAARGDAVAATEASRSAKRLSWIALCAGWATIAIVIVIAVVYIAVIIPKLFHRG